MILIGCKENLNDKMYVLVDEQFQNDSCNVSFNDLIQEPWEQLYLIDAFSMPSEISNAIGFKYLGNMVGDSEYKIIVTYQKKILKEESFDLSRMVFRDNDSNGIIKISRNDRFCVEYNSSVTPHFYYLKEMK